MTKDDADQLDAVRGRAITAYHDAITNLRIAREKRSSFRQIIKLAAQCVDTWAAEDGVWTNGQNSEPIAPWPTPEQVVQIIDQIAAEEAAVEQARKDLQKTGINPDVLYNRHPHNADHPGRLVDGGVAARRAARSQVGPARMEDGRSNDGTGRPELAR